MQEVIFNPNGEILHYYNLDEILRLDIPEELKQEFRDKFNKRVYCDYRDTCKVGTLIGLEIHEQLSEYYFILEDKGQKFYIIAHKSLTKL